MPIGKTLGPKRPRLSMILFTDFTNDVSISPRSPSDVPDDCIMRCIVRKSDLRTENREIARSPVYNDQEISLKCQPGCITGGTNILKLRQLAIFS